MYELQRLERLIKDIEERDKKLKAKYHNHKVGYAPKCKVCNSEYLDDIELLRKEGYTYEEILEELELTDISLMSLSRHFKNHFPKSQAYKNKQEIQMLENIREAYLKYPFLEDYFKDKDIQYLERFNNTDGFCTDKFCLCSSIPASTVSNGNRNIPDLYRRQEEEIDKKREYSFLFDDNKINEIKLQYNQKVIDCLNCRNQIQEERLNLLEKIITYNFLNIPTDNKELYFNLLEFDGNPEEFIEILNQAKEETNPAK